MDLKVIPKRFKHDVTLFGGGRDGWMGGEGGVTCEFDFDANSKRARHVLALVVWARIAPQEVPQEPQGPGAQGRPHCPRPRHGCVQ